MGMRNFVSPHKKLDWGGPNEILVSKPKEKGKWNIGGALLKADHVEPIKMGSCQKLRMLCDWVGLYARLWPDWSGLVCVGLASCGFMQLRLVRLVWPGSVRFDLVASDRLAYRFTLHVVLDLIWFAPSKSPLTRKQQHGPDLREPLLQQALPGMLADRLDGHVFTDSAEEGSLKMLQPKWLRPRLTKMHVSTRHKMAPWHGERCSTNWHNRRVIIKTRH